MHDKLHDDDAPPVAAPIRITAAVPKAKYPLEPPKGEQVGVPRRFGIGILMILTAAFAVLCGVLQSLDAQPPEFTIIGILFFGVAAGQVLLFQGTNPRLASVIVGGILFPLETVVYYAIMGARNPVDAYVVVGLSVFGGPLFGYLAGGLTAGLFLVLNRLSGSNAAGEPRPKLACLPFETHDLPTLLTWIEPKTLHALLTRDHEEAINAARLRTDLATAAEPDAPLRLMKLTEEASGTMLGFAEIVEINRAARLGRLRFVIVDPRAHERGWLSDELLAAIKRHAFEDLGLDELRVHVLSADLPGLACYLAAGFASQEFDAGELAACPPGYRTLRAESPCDKSTK